MNKAIGMILVVAMGFSTSVFASGFKCESEDGLRVKLCNSTHQETRTPAVLIISNQEEGTLLVQRDDSILKVNRDNSTLYTTLGSEKLGASLVLLEIEFKEGRDVVRAGTAVQGRLFLISESDEQLVNLDCVRYLKDE